MKLTPQEINFIDNYLLKSDVIFADVRVEMTDHVATAVENKMETEALDFYDAFRNYMAVNKKELLASRNKLYRYFPNVMLDFLKTLYKPYNLFFGLLLIVVFSYLSKSGETIGSKNSYRIVLFAVLGIALIQLLYSLVIIKKRYLYLEKTSVVLMVINYTNLFINYNPYGNYWSIGVTVFLLFAFIVYYIETIIKFKKRYV